MGKQHIAKWLIEPTSKSVTDSLDRLANLEDVCHLAVMPDVHLANEVCIGTVVATRQLVYPAAVGSDIGCGMAALRFECCAQLLNGEQNAASLLAGLYRHVPTNRLPSSTAGVLPAELQEFRLSDRRLDRLKERDDGCNLALSDAAIISWNCNRTKRNACG